MSFVFGALLLFDPAGDTYQVSLPVAIAIAGSVALFMAFAVAKVVQVRRQPVAVGTSSLVGTPGVVRPRARVGERRALAGPVGRR